MAQRHPNGIKHYEDVAKKKQSVLLIRTGNESNLSAPISFDALKDQVLPLERSEDIQASDLIRVPLKIGVRFVANLLVHEEAALPALVLPTITKDRDHPGTEQEIAALEYAERSFELAQERGRILPVSMAAAVQKAMIITPRPAEEHEYPPDYYDPETFVLGWV